MSRERTIYNGQTDLDSYQVVDMVYEGRLARVLFGGDHRAAQSGVARDEQADLLFDYNQRFLELANGLRPKRTLIIGGGAYTLPMTLLWALPKAMIDVVELDPGLWDIAEAFFGAKDNPRLHRVADDGAVYVQQVQTAYNLIILDAFIQASIPAAFKTPVVIQAMHRRLSPGGALAINIIAAWFGTNSRNLQRFVALLQKTFKVVEVFPAGYGVSLWQPQNFVIVAADSQTTASNYLRYGALSGQATSQPFDVAKDVFGR